MSSYISYDKLLR